MLIFYLNSTLSLAVSDWILFFILKVLWEILLQKLCVHNDVCTQVEYNKSWHWKDAAVQHDSLTRLDSEHEALGLIRLSTIPLESRVEGPKILGVTSTRMSISASVLFSIPGKSGIWPPDLLPLPAPLLYSSWLAASKKQSQMCHWHAD